MKPLTHKRNGSWKQMTKKTTKYDLQAYYKEIDFRKDNIVDIIEELINGKRALLVRLEEEIDDCEIEDERIGRISYNVIKSIRKLIIIINDILKVHEKVNIGGEEKEIDKTSEEDYEEETNASEDLEDSLGFEIEDESEKEEKKEEPEGEEDRNLSDMSEREVETNIEKIKTIKIKREQVYEYLRVFGIKSNPKIIALQLELKETSVMNYISLFRSMEEDIKARIEQTQS